MKKFLQLIIATIIFCPFFSAPVSAIDECCYDECYYDEGIDDFCCNAFSLEAQYATVFPLDSKVGRIYGYALPSFTLQGSWNYKCWSIWLDGSYTFANGEAIGCGSGRKTHLSFVPITLGVKYIYTVCQDTEVYFGLGACYSFLNTKDHSEYVHEKTSANNTGAIVKTGFVYHYCDGFFLEGFFNYMYQKFYFHKEETDPFVYRNDVDFSSLQLGVGIGWTF